MAVTSSEPTREDLVAKHDKKPDAGSQDQYKTPPDGGWGWVVCLGALMVNFLTVGQQNSSGVVYSALLREFSTQRGETGERTFRAGYFNEF